MAKAELHVVYLRSIFIINKIKLTKIDGFNSHIDSLLLIFEDEVVSQLIGTDYRNRNY